MGFTPCAGGGESDPRSPYEHLDLERQEVQNPFENEQYEELNVAKSFYIASSGAPAVSTWVLGESAQLSGK